MSEIRRFEQDYGCMVPEFDGGWVEFVDHEVELTALRQQLADAVKRAEAAEALRSAGINAIVVIKGLAEQQAMPDDSYKPGLADLVAAVKAAKQEGGA